MIPVIETRHLSKEYKISIKQPGVKGVLRSFFKKEYRSVHAVKDLTIQINKGELVGFLGPNGAGKTTTLKLLSGLLYPTSGSLSILGFIPSNRERAFQKKFSMVMGQRTQLWWDLPARETFKLNQKIYEVPDSIYKKWVEELIDLLDLKELVELPVKKLSLGERMKAELCCALIHSPEILLLDEPTLGLDLIMQKKLRSFIQSYNEKTGATILLTSHNMSDVEELCKRVMIIDEGQLLFDGALEKIVHHFAPDKVVTLSTSTPLVKEQLEKMGKIVAMNGKTASIEVPRQAVMSRLQALFSQGTLIDLSIEEMSIEEIIRRAFLKASSLKEIEPRTKESLEPSSEEKPNTSERLLP